MLAARPLFPLNTFSVLKTHTNIFKRGGQRAARTVTAPEAGLCSLQGR